MTIYVPQFDSSPLPLTLGSPLRVPSYAYTNWGIHGDEQDLMYASEEAYRVEWEHGSPKQMQYVTDAITRAGYFDFPQILRTSNAKAVSRVVKGIPGKFSITDVGAGLSTVDIFDELDENDKDRVYLVLLEPAEEKVENAASLLGQRGLKRDRDYKVIVARDLDMKDYLEPESQNVMSYVATLHHHAYLDIPLSLVYRTLKHDGFLTSADWHNSMWEHPAKVLYMLRKLGVNKRYLDEFTRAYPKSLEVVDFDNDELVRNANQQIMDFWVAWADVRRVAVRKNEFEERDDIWMLEGHRPVERYLECMERVGFHIKETSSLLPDSRLLMQVVAHKR